MLLACIAIFVACKLGSKKKHYFRNQMYFGDFTATNCPQKCFLQPPIIEPISVKLMHRIHKSFACLHEEVFYGTQYHLVPPVEKD
jgi:hypothetical protein